VFFLEQAGELLVIVLSLREKHDPVYKINRTRKPYTWSQAAYNAHPKHTTSTHPVQTPAKKAHDRDTGHQNRVTTEATTRSRTQTRGWRASTYSPPREVGEWAAGPNQTWGKRQPKRCRRQCTLRLQRPIVLKTKPVRWFNQKKPKPKLSPVF
jgi:hypothetical protein